MIESPQNGHNRDGHDRKLVGYLRFSGAGLQLFAAVGLCTLIGWWLDGKTGLSPVFLIAGAFFGFLAGFYTLYMELFGRKAGKKAGRKH